MLEAEISGVGMRGQWLLRVRTMRRSREAMGESLAFDAGILLVK